MKHQHTLVYDRASRAGHKALKHLKTGYETRKQNLPVTELTENLHLIHYEIFFLLETVLWLKQWLRV